MKNGFLNNLEFLFSATENVLNNVKSRLFQKKHLDKISTCEPSPDLATEPTKNKKSTLKLQQEFMNENTAKKKIQMMKYFELILSIRIHGF